MRQRMIVRVHAAQDEITAALSAIDGQAFHEDLWERPGGGGGRTRVLEGGDVIEKGGVNVSAVHGTLSEAAAQSMRGRGLSIDDPRFFATGLSLVLHPRNPYAPTVHANYRYFELGAEASPTAWWFGGGTDLTPNYLFDQDVRHFHGVLKAWCDEHDPAYYPRFKEWCDEYFLVRHRKETRGVGGIFFDDLHDRSRDEVFAFASGGLSAFLPAYLPLLEKRKDTPYAERERAWQGLRHGRYVEFNLVWDRGTAFGLRTDARIESVLMSLPQTASWAYDHHPEPGSPEAALVEVLKSPRDWV
ncbi:MAG: oxygen-dependent coproporphyrinogen oxidase [Proteobacteria bacterium]|nr:oxygen-dependent coproporphyrinogen oxidase [Pseudomonadota bacterium]MCP4919944.1 oxygen-dependent coproporphyrinogen oxidase [Pseudomonadota bacterium]